MGGGVSVCNNTGIELLFKLSQVSRLHEERVLPRKTKKINCRKVWFTVSAKLWDDNEALAKVVAEDSKEWLAYTPSKESADWLAKNNIIAVVPVSERGVYANENKNTLC